MTHSSTILVGVDGSAASMHALDWAIQEAKQLGWSIQLVCAFQTPSFTAASLDGGYAALDNLAIRQGAQAVLDRAKARVKTAGVRVSTTLETGDPAGVLVKLSRQAGLAVVGTRGRGGFAERLLGTVSSALPAHGHCPTVVVPLITAGSDQASARVSRPQRIVIGVDGSPSAEGALSRAIDEACAWGATLTAFSAISVSTGTSLFAWAPAVVNHEAILADLESGLDSTIEKALAGRTLPESVTIRRHALDGTAASLLVEFSTAVDLVVVGSRGRGGFSGLLLGSTSQAVLHHAVCPVMVVPAGCLDEGLPPAAVAGRG